ncbi:MAG: CDP-alcohol phosphatidyltransferase family protein [Deltaproteobacteria bacterium]|nr:CDP-alcohol phosphatidyltransferase family protein [Deltaproteobacteria bacterium]
MGPRLGRERFDQARLINIANALTAIRILLLPFFAGFLISGRFRKGLLVFLVCGASDLLDGLLARLLRQRTVVGFYLDPIADKLLMATAFVVLAYVRIVPTWFAVLVISRDLFILIGSALILLLIGSEGIRPTRISKANTATQVATVVYFLLIKAFPGLNGILPPHAEPALTRAIVSVCAATTAVSGLQYMVTGLRKLSHA